MEKEFKVSERSKVLLVRDKRTRNRYVYREYAGSGDVYRAMQGIECPYLPKIEAVEEHNGYVYIVEEYVQGDTLAFILKGGALDEELAKRITIQICRALETLHALGVVHRDIKPENIILRGEEAVLIDFDASRLCKEEQISDTQVMGTAGYAAPEQYGFSQTDARADIYALGILLNEMLVRQHPAKQLAKGRFLPAIEKCIEVNMDKRYGSAEELRSALEHEVSDAPERKRTVWSRRLIAALAVALILGGAFYGVNKTPTSAETNTPVSPSEDIIPASTEKEFLQSIQISWHDDPEAYGTEFQYDLDGDGKTETYLFAGMYNFVDEPRLLQNSGTDITQRPEILEVAPAVWRQTDLETYEIVEEFAVLLSKATVTLQQKEGEQEGIFEAIDDLYGIWPGSFRATFARAGLWQYAFTAELAGETLSAVGTTRTTVENQMSKKDNLEAETNYTVFQYDLDGDGREEEYLFGGVFYRSDGNFAFSEGEVGLPAHKNYINNRRVAPGVWQQTSSGSYEPVEAFASLLTDAKVTFRCLEGDSHPEIWQEDELLAPWSGAIRVKYTQNGVWQYEFSARLAGRELSATAWTRTTREG